MKAVSSQRKQLYRLFTYNKETEAIHVQQATGDSSKSTAADLTVIEADKLIKGLTTNWAVFDKNNGQHLNILSLLLQIGWTRTLKPYGKVADMYRLSDFLKSNKSPVVKPLQNMAPKETSKIIVALEGILKSTHK